MPAETGINTSRRTFSKAQPERKKKRSRLSSFEITTAHDRTKATNGRNDTTTNQKDSDATSSAADAVAAVAAAERARTRVCIKNVPPSFDETKLTKHLCGGSKSGSSHDDIVVTDCRILKTKDGKSRRLAFVGFKTSEMATYIVKHFHNTFALTCKLHVDYAFSKKTPIDTSVYRPWSKHSVGSSRYEQEVLRKNKRTGQMENINRGGEKDVAMQKEKGGRDQQTLQVEEKEEGEEESEEVRKKKAEFLAAMGVVSSTPGIAGGTTKGGKVIRQKNKFWSNDEGGLEILTNQVENENEEADVETKGPQGSLDKEVPDVSSTIREETDETDNDDNGDGDDDDGDSDSIDSVDSGGEGADAILNAKRRRDKKEHGMAPILTAPFGSAEVQMSDMDFLRSKVTAAENLTDDENENQTLQDSPNDAEVQNVKSAQYDGEDVSVDSSGSDSDSTSGSDGSDSEEEHESETNAGEPKHEVSTTEALARRPGQEESTDAPSGRPSSELKPAFAGGSGGGTSSNVDQIAPNRLFVRNLPFAATESELGDLFESYGTVLECHIPVDDAKRSKGYGFVKFVSSDDAACAMKEIDKTDFQGRLVHVLPARRGHDDAVDDSEEGGTGDGDMTYKQKQDMARKKGAERITEGWMASHVRGDAVVDNLSDRLGLAKGDILNVKDGLSSGGAAVRLALGETHIIEENRDYFRKHGIDMDALVSGSSSGGGDKAKAKRSSDSILVKNLPYDTNLEDLTKLFHLVGGDAPRRILLPPSRTVALVEYGHSTDAKRAFRKLAYRRFKHVPLYLEWAPLQAKRAEVAATSAGAQHETTTPENMIDEGGKMSSILPKSETMEPEADQNEEPGVSHTVYVKNLNFNTSEERLRSVFETKLKSSVRAVKIPKKLAPVKKVHGRHSNGAQVKEMSMGFGFVECQSEEAAQKAIRVLQGSIVDGHALELKLSSRDASRSSAARKTTLVTGEGKKTKLMVRNVPFQATRTELLQLFGSFGQLKKVRLPKKFDGTHRGFAFIEFLTGQEAQNAMNALSSTHLYGRHLVLEWAEDKEDMETLRDKAKRDIHAVVVGDTANLPSSLRSKKFRSG